MATTLVPVDVSRDPESGSWRYSIDNPPIVSGGQSTREAAMQATAEALTEILAPRREPLSEDPTVRSSCSK